MRRWDAYKDMHQNGTIVNHFPLNEERTDNAAPNLVMSQIWLQDDRTQVEIIELDSDETEPELNEDQGLDCGSIWNYLDKERFLIPQQDFYNANKKAREKRRMQDLDNYEDDLPETVQNERISVPNKLFSSFYEFTNDHSVKNNARKQRPNCFTIINKPFHTPDSSSDEIDSLNTPDNLNNDGIPEGEIVTFDEDVESAKRTIWIYSFRNKRVLSENDFELVNIPSRDSDSSTTSCSLDNFIEERTETKRVASPIPATYVPRLNLSLAPTLPTLTEITEPAKNVQKETQKSDDKTSIQIKCVNNWLPSETISTKGSKDKDKQDESSNTNVINWMCLSPRERRRRFRHTYAGPTYQPNLPVLAEVPSSEPIPRNTLTNHDLNKIQTTVDIHVTEQKPETIQRQTSKSKLTYNHSQIGETTTVAIDDEDNDNEKEDLKTPTLHKPRIIFNSRRTSKTEITDPLEKLHSNKWIHDDVRENICEKEYDIPDHKIQPNYDTGHQIPEKECAGKKLWARNMSLLKPVEWAEFMPITDSIPSLQLSLDSDPRKHTWLSRLARCFRCFK